MNYLPRLIAIIDLEYCGSLDRWFKVLRDIDGGEYGSYLQVHVRAKNHPASESHEIFARARDLFRSDTPLILNGATRTALQYRFNGVHWPEVRISGEGTQGMELDTVSASIHGDELVDSAIRKGVNQLVFAPIFQPDWKNARPRGLKSLQTLAHKSTVPIYALGGVTPGNCGSCLASGAHGVAALSSICASEHPCEVVDSYLAVLDRTP